MTFMTGLHAISSKQMRKRSVVFIVGNMQCPIVPKPVISN